MKKNAICFFVVCMMLLIEASMVQGVTLFGPRSYERTQGSPNKYHDVVYATAGDGVLLIRNGDENGKHRVTSAKIFVNDNQVLFQNDFKNDILFLEVPIILESVNDIRVELGSKPGTFLILEITQEEDLPSDPPEVTLSVEPETIVAGSFSSLFWNSSNAETCELDQNIGPVNLNENQGYPVSPAEETTYTITCSGPGGTAAAAVIVTVLSPISLSVIEPASGITVKTPDILVRGKENNLAGNETGITVNGMPARTGGDVFFMNNFALTDGENIITVVAVDTAGNTAESSVVVNFDASAPFDWIEMSINPESGLAPFSTTLTVESNLSFTPVGQPVLTVSGPGTAAETWISDTEINLEFIVPGVYTVDYELIDDQGNAASNQIMVNVLDRDELETFLFEKWDNMTAALANNQIDMAMNYFATSAQGIYNPQFTALEPVLAEIAAELQSAQLTFIDYGGWATFEIITNREGVNHSFNLHFIIDADGLWKIYRF